MHPLQDLLLILAVYFALQIAFALISRFIGPARLTGQVLRAVWVSLLNHVYFIAAAIWFIRDAPLDAKITTGGFWWVIPLGLFIGFFFFIFVEAVTRASRKLASEFLFDLQVLGLSPAFPKYVLVPAVINYLIAKPIGEELLFRGFMLGVMTDRVHPLLALALTVIIENLRYPQVAWIGRNTFRALVLGGLFLLSPSILLPLAASFIAHSLGAFAQVAKMRRVLSEQALKGKAPPGSLDDLGRAGESGAGEDE